jgi:hypothetical protein
MVVIGAKMSSSKDLGSYGLKQELKSTASPKGKANNAESPNQSEGSSASQSNQSNLREGEVPENDDHFSLYAFDGRTGKLRWKHEAKDFTEESNAHDALHPQHEVHLGEIDWTKFRHDILKSLPHFWNSRHDNAFEIAHFQQRRIGQDRKKAQQIQQQIKISRWSDDLKVFAGKKLLPHSDSEHVRKPNAIVVHRKDGIEVIHMFTGRTISHLALKPNTMHVDLNGDGVIDHIEAIGHTPHTSSNSLYSYGLSPHINSHNNGGDKPQTCIFQVSSGIPPIAQLFSASICGRHLGLLIGLFDLRSQNEYQPVDYREFRVAPPTVMKLPARPGSRAKFDSLYFINTGTVTCFGPEGAWKWTSDTASSWLSKDTVDESIDVELRKQAMRATLQTFALYSANDEYYKSMVAVVGEDTITVLDAQGHKHASAKIPDFPIANAVIGDINNDGVNDIIITTSSGYFGFVLERRLGVKLFTVLIGLLLICLVLSFIVRYMSGQRRESNFRFGAGGSSAYGTESTRPRFSGSDAALYASQPPASSLRASLLRPVKASMD